MKILDWLASRPGVQETEGRGSVRDTPVHLLHHVLLHWRHNREPPIRILHDTRSMGWPRGSGRRLETLRPRPHHHSLPVAMVTGLITTQRSELGTIILLPTGRRYLRKAWTGGDLKTPTDDMDFRLLVAFFLTEQEADWWNAWGCDPDANTHKIFRNRANADAWRTFSDGPITK